MASVRLSGCFHEWLNPNRTQGLISRGGLHRQLPALRREYQTRMDRDERFQEDPEHCLDFWISRIPYHDPTFNKYPVMRTDLGLNP